MPALRPCIVCSALSPQSRCPAHARGSTAARGYASAHQRQASKAKADYDPESPCWRCGKPLGPDPSKLHLDHDPDDRSRYVGLVHGNPCNSGRITPRD